MNDPTEFEKFTQGAPVIFTRHSIERLRESQLEVKRAKALLYQSVKSPFNVSKKNKRFTRNQEDVSYWMYGPLTYTVLHTDDRKKIYDKIFLVLTVTDSRAVSRYMGVRGIDEEMKISL